MEEERGETGVREAKREGGMTVFGGQAPGEWAQPVGRNKEPYRPPPRRWRDSETLKMIRNHVEAKADIGGCQASSSCITLHSKEKVLRLANRLVASSKPCLRLGSGRSHVLQ